MADQSNICTLNSEKVTPEPKRFYKYTSDSESDHLQNNIVMEEVLSHHDDPQSDTDSVVQSNTSPSTSHSLPSQPPIIFTTTEGQLVNLSEVVKASVDSALSHIIGSINKHGNAQLICRFRNWKIKNSIFQQKRKLKNNPDKTVITEDLTQYRQYLMKKLDDARKRHEIDSFWTMDGRIFAKKTPEATKKCIGGMEDLSDLNVNLFTEHNHVLNDLMTMFCLQNVVKEATRFDHRSRRATLLDPILISEDCCATFTEVIDMNRQMSDHNATKEQFYLNANGLLDEKSNKNPKAFWSLVKKVMGNCRSTSIPPLLNPNTNEIFVGEKEKADLLNSYFCNISTSLDDGVTPPDLPLRIQHSLDIDEITEDEIKDILKSLEIG
ncbi:unnamed protein product [Mytilus edulis]|uniref:Uncharacterized protein n=1 Tax=Mytilus edulis TaxID=6550 RepID=A0A8S3QCZ1_MYTED|nr:unnamed protein product [Mytilus edulis]